MTRFIFLMIVLCTSATVTTSANSQPNAVSDQIAFILYERDEGSVCIIGVGNGGYNCFAQVANSIAQAPVWSPNGRAILFRQPYVVCQQNSLIVDVQSGEITPLPTHSARVVDWSPDATQFLMVGRVSTESDSDIYVMQTDGSNVQDLTRDEEEDEFPAWSPDGTQIAYLSGFPEATLMVMKADGTNQRALTADLPLNREVQPTWSPDSSTLAFAVYGSVANANRTSEIYTAQVDGSHVQPLTAMNAISLDPRWSPDGSQIVFWSYEVDAFDDLGDNTSLRTEVFRVNADGSDLINLTQSTGADRQPSWSPDGEWIAFSSNRESPGIFIMRPDGSDVRMVTNEPPFSEGGREANNPVWRPAGQ